jgi:hypothetical protein
MDHAESASRPAIYALTSTHRRQVGAALAGRPVVGIQDEIRRGQKTRLYRLLDEPRPE